MPDAPLPYGSSHRDRFAPASESARPASAALSRWLGFVSSASASFQMTFTVGFRALASIRWVRRWYWDDSRDVDVVPRPVWESLTPEQRTLMRFPLGA